MQVSKQDTGKRSYIVTFDDTEMAKITNLASKDKSLIVPFIEKMLESGLNLYRFIILGKDEPRPDESPGTK